MASASTESSLLSKLESVSSSPDAAAAVSAAAEIHSLFSTYLRPFSDLSTDLKPKKPSKSATQQQQTAIRSLAKQHLSFLSRSLSLIPKLLSGPRPGQSHLFQTYKLCLQCIDSISSQLTGNPYSVHVQRLRMVHCLVSCGLHADAQTEGFAVLDSLRAIDFGGRTKGRAGGGFLPELKHAGEDEGIRELVVEIVVLLVKCVALAQSKDEKDYTRVLDLVEEARPWFRVLDAKAYEKFHRVFVSYLRLSTLFLIGENKMCFSKDLLRRFIISTFAEYRKSSLKGETEKVARRICSSLLSTPDDRSSLIFDLINYLSDFTTLDGKVQEEARIELIELVGYCANNCRDVSNDFCYTFAANLERIPSQKNLMPDKLIMRLYAAGLYMAECNFKPGPRDSGSTSSSSKDVGAAIQYLLIKSNGLDTLSCLLDPLESYFSTKSKENHSSFHDKGEYLHGQVYPGSVSRNDTFASSGETKKEAYLPSYMNSLKFLCQPFSRVVNSERQYLLAGNQVNSSLVKLGEIQSALSRSCEVFVFYCRHGNKMQKDEFEDNIKILLSGAVAALTLSFTTKFNLQKTMDLISHIITSEWVQEKRLKSLSNSLYTISVILYRNKQLTEAAKALKLSCDALWRFVKQGLNDFPVDDIVECINEACAWSAFHLDVLHQCGSEKIERVFLGYLENWSVAQKRCGNLPGPMSIVKRWVKIHCRQQKSIDVDDKFPSLHHLIGSYLSADKDGTLSSSLQALRESLPMLLEQELHAYEEMSTVCPKLCNTMQMEVIDFLIREVDTTPGADWQKSRLLIKKGIALRTRGVEILDDSIKCFSEAIEMIENSVGGLCHTIPDCHLLATAHSLRALLTYEVDPRSKGVIQDVSDALSLWSRVFSDDCSAKDLSSVLFEVLLPLLYNISDLLAIKGCLELHLEISKLIIEVFRWKSIPLEKCLVHLWECRRTSHALCVSPISEAFTKILLEHFGEISNSMHCWICCLKESQPLITGFKASFLFSFSNTSPGSFNPEISFQPYVGVEEVKEAFHQLVSHVPLHTRSVFFAGYLYYDMCERLIWSGCLNEALLFAKESQRLRTRLFHEKFTCNVEQLAEKCNGIGEITQRACCIKNIQVSRSVAEDWPSDFSTFNLEGCYISPWNVLQCYLESILQVGTIYELVGNAAEAENFLQWGKNISCTQDLPHFIVSFSCILGKIYRRKQLWDLAKLELQRAEQILKDRVDISSCKCCVLLHATVDQQLGDLARSHADSTRKVTFTEKLDEAEMIYRSKLTAAEMLYKSALDKLGISSFGFPSEPTSKSSMSQNTHMDVGHQAISDSRSIPDGPQNRKNPSKRDLKMETRKARKPRCLPKPKPNVKSVTSDVTKRVTRSMVRSSNDGQTLSAREEVRSATSSDGGHASGCDFNEDQSYLPSQLKNSRDELQSEVLSNCNNMKGRLCYSMDVIKSGTLASYVHLRWQFNCRRLSLGLLNGIGKCIGQDDEVHAAHHIFLQSVSNIANQSSSSLNGNVDNFLLDLIGKEMPGNLLAIEHAALLYSISWVLLMSHRTRHERKKCCILSDIELPQIISWLKLAFVLCHELPLLMQKVSRLLAITYVYSASSEPFSSSSDALSEYHWASYFHQASLGSHLNQLFCSNQRSRTHSKDVEEVAEMTSSTPPEAETFNFPRLVPGSVQDLPDFVTKFFMCLPCATIICICVLGDSDASLLQELFPSSARAYMLLSRLNSKNQPLVLLLPLDPIIEDASDDSNSDTLKLPRTTSTDKLWRCPWGSSVVDDVIPTFREILEENYSSSSVQNLKERNELKAWWAKRKYLDSRLSKLLRKIEDSWFGPLRCLLLGGLLDTDNLDSVHKKLVWDLKLKCKVDVNEALVKVILGGSKSAISGAESILPELQLSRGWHIGKISSSASRLVHEAVNELEVETNARESVILVLDSQVQMLPWESFPTLRSQEVYRMPSVGSIFMTIDRIMQSQERHQKTVPPFSFIDPLDAYYLLNPDGDLSSTQVEFENWFQDQKLQGNAGSAPAAEELGRALQNHDLFIYLGHGCGAQYIPRHEIQKLQRCAASLLLGCSSGSLSLNGAYIPEGTVLSYLLAGSPAIIANLWEVTDKDIDRFGRATLEAWLKERKESPTCSPCSSLVKEFKALDMKPLKQPKKKPSEPDGSVSSSCIGCELRGRVASFMGQARGACTLPFLIGAAPVCYGVPTGIIKRKDMSR